MSAPARRGRAGRLVRQLSERDLGLLAVLHQLRLMTGAQLERLFDQDNPTGTRARRARRRLQRLYELGLVVRLDRRIGGRRAGSSGYVYSLSGLGQSVLAVPGLYGRRRRVWETSPRFQDHVLAVADLHVALCDCEHHGELELLSFEAEPPCWRRFTGSSGGTVVLKPDAFVEVGVGELALSAFVEIDMATEGLPTIERKCHVYLDYWRSGQEQQTHGVFPRVLWLVPDERRRERLATVLARLPEEGRALFTVGAQAEGAWLLMQPPAPETRA